MNYNTSRPSSSKKEKEHLDATAQLFKKRPVRSQYRNNAISERSERARSERSEKARSFRDWESEIGNKIKDLEE